MILRSLTVLTAIGFASIAFAADCVTSFDENCLSREYKTGEIKSEQERRAKELEEFQHAAEKEEVQEAEADAKEAERQQAEAVAEERSRPHFATQQEWEDAFRSPHANDAVGDIILRDLSSEPTVNVRIVP